LWILQVLLAILFLFAGGFKLSMPIAALTAQVPVSGLLLQFVSVCEILGGLGMILPGVFHFKPILTPLAALGLFIIMIGAVVITLMTMPVLFATMPFVVGVLAALVAYGRWKISPLGANKS